LHWQISEHIEEGGMQEGMNLISIWKQKRIGDFFQWTFILSLLCFKENKKSFPNLMSTSNFHPFRKHLLLNLTEWNEEKHQKSL
jgi:hypothetical protein